MTNLEPTLSASTTGFEPALGTSFPQGDKAFKVVAEVCNRNVEAVVIVSPTGTRVRLIRGQFDAERYVGRDVFNRANRALNDLQRSYRDADMRWAHLNEVEIEMTGDEMVAFMKAAAQAKR